MTLRGASQYCVCIEFIPQPPFGGLKIYFFATFLRVAKNLLLSSCFLRGVRGISLQQKNSATSLIAEFFIWWREVDLNH
jgi:hypothetical protein